MPHPWEGTVERIRKVWWLGAVAVLTALAVLYIVNQRSWDSCRRQVQQDDFASAEPACSRAVATGWAFQVIDSQQYRAALSNLGLAQLELQDYRTAKKTLSDAQRLFEQSDQGPSRGHAVL